MKSYSIIDAQLDLRAVENGWTVIREWAEAPARFFYIGGSEPRNCFQVSIELPVGEEIAVAARSVDTDDEREFEQTWRGRIAEFDSLLTSAVAQIETWKSRAP